MTIKRNRSNDPEIQKIRCLFHRKLCTNGRQQRSVERPKFASEILKLSSVDPRFRRPQALSLLRQRHVKVTRGRATGFLYPPPPPLFRTSHFPSLTCGQQPPKFRCSKSSKCISIMTSFKFFFSFSNRHFVFQTIISFFFFEFFSKPHVSHLLFMCFSTSFLSWGRNRDTCSTNKNSILDFFSKKILCA